MTAASEAPRLAYVGMGEQWHVAVGQWSLCGRKAQGTIRAKRPLVSCASCRRKADRLYPHQFDGAHRCPEVTR